MKNILLARNLLLPAMLGLSVTACTVAPSFGTDREPRSARAQPTTVVLAPPARDPAPIIVHNAYEYLDIQVPGVRIGEERRRHEWRRDYDRRDWHRGYDHDYDHHDYYRGR